MEDVLWLHIDFVPLHNRRVDPMDNLAQDNAVPKILVQVSLNENAIDVK